LPLLCGDRVMRSQRRKRRETARRRKILFLCCLLLLVGVLFYLGAHADFPQGAGRLLPLPIGEPAPHVYDLVVVGTDPEGIAAAVSAARSGLQVLLLDRRDRPGGLFTLGWLNTLDMNHDPQGNLLTRGIFAEFFAQVEGISFDVQTAEQVFTHMLAAEENLELRWQAEVADTEVIEGHVISIGLVGGERIRARHFIDATQDGDLFSLAGASYTVGMEDIGTDRRQAVTLVLKVAGVDWQTVVRTLNSPERERKYNGAHGTSAWGFMEEMRAYRALDPQIRPRGLNMGRQNDGTVLINAMHIFGVDGLDPASRREAMERGYREAEHMVSFMRQTLPGFANAYLAATAPELYVRETRHLQGLYRLTIDDVMEHRNFWDKIALGSYPVDIQATAMDDWGAVIGNPALFSIPFRSLVPRELYNLLVVGRAASYDSLAHGSARVVPVGMAAGEAAGVAAAIALEKGVDFHRLSADRELIALLQERLRDQGAYLPDFAVPHSMEGHPLYPVVRELRAWGLVRGGYDNNYRLDEEAELRDISRVVGGYLERALGGRYQAGYLPDARKPAYVSDLRRILESIEGAEHLQAELDTLLQKYAMTENRLLYRGETYSLLLQFLRQL